MTGDTANNVAGQSRLLQKMPARPGGGPVFLGIGANLLNQGTKLFHNVFDGIDQAALSPQVFLNRQQQSQTNPG
jgi:hypothetical protein